MATGFGDMGSLLKQAQEMQRRMQETTQSLSERVLEGSAGGGVVKAFVSGSLELKAVKIGKEAVDPEDVETLEDLVAVAVGNALAAAKDLRDREMAKITGGMSLPGMGF
ncbi:MAG: YbaB/EbfC family nucleoid-associated protein [Planctomycetota bacterium]